MTYKDVISELEQKIELAKRNLAEAQDPNGPWAGKQYFFLLAQNLARRALVDAENDLSFLLDFLTEFQINLENETGGLETLILRLERKDNRTF